MRVLITGGTGLIGKAAAERFIQRGWDVRIVDLAQGVEVAGAEVIHCDIMNYDALREQVRGCQAIVHLAAIRGPSLAPGHKIFEINVAGTFNVFEAAAAEGIYRVVQASSINALGAYYSLQEIMPQYLPIDEDHPSLTTDPYSYSKELAEDIGRYFWRRARISSVALRFPGVYRRGHLQSDHYRQHRQQSQSTLDEFMALPVEERQNRLMSVKAQVLQWREQRPLEFKDNPPEPLNRDAKGPLWFMYGVERFNFWAVLDERDAAQSLEKSVTAEYDGAPALFINDAYNSIGYDAKVLARLFFSNVNESRLKLSGSTALISIDKARRLIGFEPEYSVEK